MVILHTLSMAAGRGFWKTLVDGVQYQKLYLGGDEKRMGAEMRLAHVEEERRRGR